MIVIGVDCGKNRVHMYANELEHFSAEIRSGAPRDKALQYLRGKCVEYLDTVTSIYKGPPTLYVEAPVIAGARNIQATIGIAETVGMVLSLGYEAILVPVGSWKKAAVGKGNCTKEEVQRWYEEGGGSLKGQDFYDAAGIAEYGRQDVAIAERLRRGQLTISEG